MRSMQAAIRATFMVLRGPTEYVLPIIILPPPFLISYHTDDWFLCNTCSVKGIQPPEKLDKELLHTYLHPLVRCKERVEDPVKPPPPTVEDRLGELECKVCSRHEVMEAKLVQIEQTLALLQQSMTTLLNSKSNGSV